MEIFLTSYSRLLHVVEKLIFVKVKNDKSKIIIERIEGEKDIVINKTPITDWIRERFQEEIKRYIQNKNQKKI